MHMKPNSYWMQLLPSFRGIYTFAHVSVSCSKLFDKIDENFTKKAISSSKFDRCCAYSKKLNVRWHIIQGVNNAR